MMKVLHYAFIIFAMILLLVVASTLLQLEKCYLKQLNPAASISNSYPSIGEEDQGDRKGPFPSIGKEDQGDRKGPFLMPIHGDAFTLFQPFYDMDEIKKDVPLLASPEKFIKTFTDRITWVNTMITPESNAKKPEELRDVSVKEHAVIMYLEMIKSFVTASLFNAAEFSVRAVSRTPQVQLNGPLNLGVRMGGQDWTYAGDTMTGWARIDNIRMLLTDVIRNSIEGDYIETGVWRGGASVFARAVVKVLEPGTTRVSYVCDSFRGLPPGSANLDRGDKGWDNTPYLEIPSDIVANNFIKYDMLDSNVVFAKGFFNETMPPLSKHIQKLAVMRLDGDMYESTVDVLYHLYDKLSIGGYLIMDDWFGFPSKTACQDFFKVHGINPEIIPIDSVSAYWKKTEEVDIQYWRYEQKKFKAD